MSYFKSDRYNRLPSEKFKQGGTKTLYKIVLIHPNAGMNWNGNSENFAIEIARRLDNYFEVELLSGADCGSFSRPIKSISRTKLLNWKYFPLIKPVLSRWFDRPEVAIEHLTTFLPCLSYLLRHPADLIFPQNDYGGLLVANCIRAIRGTPILFAEHNSLSGQGKSLRRNLSLHPSRLVVTHPAMAKYIKHVAPEQIFDVIPYGIDITEFTPVGKAMATGLSKPTVLCVAPLERNSNQRLELAIAAVARLPQVSLLICGDGRDRAYFQEQGDRLLGARRFRIKAFAYAQMPQVYRSANIFTLPSLEASLGLTYLEAMACGLPVVATDDAVRRYLIGNAGITCDVTDIDIYAESIQIALERCWHQLQPRTNALDFSWQEIALRYRQTALRTIVQSNKNFMISTSQGG